MITIRNNKERGHTKLKWLDSFHTFSFNHFKDEKYNCFRALRVINDDFIAPSGGFGTHPHRDMEIITYVLSGQLQHRDSLGNGSIIKPGEIQKMTAGNGILHSEFNPSETEETHLLQIWIYPNKQSLEPAYDQIEINPDQIQNNLGLIASSDKADNAIFINQDVKLYATKLESGIEIKHNFKPKRFGWLQIAKGGANVNGIDLEQGDGAVIENEHLITIHTTNSAEVLLFDLA